MCTGGSDSAVMKRGINEIFEFRLRETRTKFLADYVQETLQLIWW